MLLELTLQALGPADEPALTALFRENDTPDATRWFDPFPLNADSARVLSHHDGRNLYWGAWSGEPRLVALAMVRGWDEGHPHPAYGCLVDRRHRGRGIGAAVTGLALDELHRRGVTEVRARVHDDNQASLRMHAAAGFEELERMPGRVIMVARPGSRS
jgi:RimJ/RimL family protein N-acetyltransferase